MLERKALVFMITWFLGILKNVPNSHKLRPMLADCWDQLDEAARLTSETEVERVRQLHHLYSSIENCPVSLHCLSIAIQFI